MSPEIKPFFILFFPFTDIVFFIFLYQRYIYKVDKSRVNEFGFSGEMEEKNKQQSLLSNGEVSEAVAAIEDTPADNEKPINAKSKKDKKRD